LRNHKWQGDQESGIFTNWNSGNCASPHYYNARILPSTTMRLRYWRIGIPDLAEASYPIEKVNHWEIKCMQGEYQHFGVFWYRYGTPYDKEPVHGICFYYNEIPPNVVQSIADFLQSKFGGKLLYRKTRVFLQGSNEFSDPKAIGNLAHEISLKFDAPIEITIEFEKVTKEEQDQNIFNLPATKMLPIVGSD